ncbi:MAG: hypothetical protein QOH96_457 [Blastocatellia bacterium]|nr:hypothetical protein [Blastocatellia bacterium]
MKLVTRTFMFSALCLFALLSVSAQKHSAVPTVKVTGVYENIRVGKESGDLEGARMIIIEGSGDYYALLQIAAGGPELPAPVLVKVTVKLASISFTIPRSDGDQAQKFTGIVTATGLKLRSSPDDVYVLKRKSCASL